MLFKDLGDFFSDFVLEVKYREIKHPPQFTFRGVDFT